MPVAAGVATPLTPIIEPAIAEMQDAGTMAHNLWCDWLRKLARENGTDYIGAALIGAAALQRGGNAKDYKPGGRLRKALDELLAKGRE